MEPRPYRDQADLDRIRNLLVEGRQANNGTYYIHTGDMLWWLFYPPRPFDFSQHLFLWEDGGRLLGWCLLTPEEGDMDVFVCPRERGSARVEPFYAWAEARLTDMVKAQGRSSIRQMLVREDDAWLNDLKRRSGFRVGDKCMVLNHRELAGPLPDPALPEGYRVQSVGGIEEGQKRAVASHGAFGSRLPFEQYWSRYRRFMESPAYTPERDLIAMAPDGRAAAFCVIWLDPVNRAGYFEPVGTHPDFQRRGLGRAVMDEGLRRLQAQGMHMASVCTYEDNPAALRLYESAGFRATHKLLTYVKDV